MKKMMKCLVLAIMVLTVAGTAWSWDFADHVKVAPGGQGDLLFYPYFLALQGGWETKVWVVNTSPNRSVVAHVAFYSARTSRDMLDFFIFLTPTDVWSGTVRFNSTTNTVELYSDDDSMMTDAGVFATKAAPVIKEFTSPVSASCQPNAEVMVPGVLPTQMGYIKIVEAAHTDAVASAAYPYPRNGITVVNLNAPPVNKLALYEAFNDFLLAANLTPPAGAAGNAGTNPLVMDGINILTGYLEIRNTVSGQDATVNATVLRDYDNQTPTGYGQSFGFSTACYSIQGPSYTSAPALGLSRVGCQAGAALDGNFLNQPGGANYICVPNTGNSYSTACGCTVAGLGCQTNSIGEVEAALAKDWVSMPYNSKTATLHFLTFPTKQTWRNTQDCYYQSSFSPFFGMTTRVIQPLSNPRPTAYSSVWDTWGCFSYQALNFDTTEKSSAVTSIFSPSTGGNSLCGEVNFSNKFGFDEGWAVYNFSSSSLLSMGSFTTPFEMQANTNNNGGAANVDAWYTGAPVIGTVLYFGPNGLTTLPASYTDGVVAASRNGTGVPNFDATKPPVDVVYTYYQYWDESNGNFGAKSNPFWATLYDLDESGCLDSSLNLTACGTRFATFAGPSGSSTIYSNKFSGNRPVILANALETTDVLMTKVRVPALTTLKTNVATTLTVTGCTIAPCPATITIAPPNELVTYTGGGTEIPATNGDLFVTIPKGTTITSSQSLTGADGNKP